MLLLESTGIPRLGEDVGVGKVGRKVGLSGVRQFVRESEEDGEAVVEGAFKVIKEGDGFWR